MIFSSFAPRVNTGQTEDSAERGRKRNESIPENSERAFTPHLRLSLPLMLTHPCLACLPKDFAPEGLGHACAGGWQETTNRVD